ncbi:MAG: MerR family DNA-binding protein [Burkholderiales bacterium]|nr:MerR family DNA-binding protein [Burkholderiales bacterium]
MLNPSPVTELLSTLHVKDLASQADVTPATVRYYCRIGLLRPGRDPDNGYRCFAATDLRRVVFIRKAQALGLTIGDIKVILDTVDHGEAPCHQVKSLVRDRLVSIRARIADLRVFEARISNALASWKDVGDQARQKGELCPLIERVGMLNGNERPALLPSKRHSAQRPRCYRHVTNSAVSGMSA